MAGEWWEHSEHTRTRGEHAGDTHGTYLEQAGNMEGTWWGYEDKDKRCKGGQANTERA